MARNTEKKDHMFARWVQLKKNDSILGSEQDTNKRRPFLASECHTIAECEKWRKSIVMEINVKMNALQNVSLGTHRLRELNDEANKLIRTKGHWERRIRELGGDTSKYERYHYEIDGVELPDSRGYKYYGKAKNLPGIQDLFEKRREIIAEEQANRRKRRSEMSQHITGAYWGRSDDSSLVADESLREKTLVQNAIKDFSDKKAKLVHELKQDAALTSSSSSRAVHDVLSAMLDDSSAELQVDVFLMAKELFDKQVQKQSHQEPTIDPDIVIEAKKRTLLSKFNL